jgi:5-methylcytosine-specific restriction endonuclease McrA
MSKECIDRCGSEVLFWYVTNKTRKETRTYKDRAEYLIRAVTKRRRKIKLFSIEYKGGKCQVCGYNKYPGALDLHHIKGTKKFTMGNDGYTHSWADIKEELDKCILVCSNCHREIHGGVAKLPSIFTV